MTKQNTHYTGNAELVQFREIVINDIKNESTEEVVNYLHTNLKLWLFSLQNLRREVELQISCQNSKFKMDISSLNSETDFDMQTPDSEYSKLSKINEIKSKHYKWRMSVLKFIANIESKTLYVKYKITEHNTSHLNILQAQ